jgi:cell division protein FtsI (penicillin-binding protein 3)
MEEGHKKMSQHWPIWPRRIDYNTYTEVKQLPLFRLPKYKSGFHEEEFNARRRPFGSLAERTIGSMFGAKDSARLGLELSYDSILRGTSGLTNRRKVLNKYMNIPVTLPVDGCDIVTTIDVNMQDLAERAVIEELKLIGGDLGVAILMEVETGDIKAIVNMTLCPDGEYREVKNNAVSDLREPGSVFKTASMLVALDDGVVDTTYAVNTGGGVYPMHGREMKDHNWRRGGYGTITLPRILEVSSNIGVSRIIDDKYGSKPEKFIEGIYRTGLAADLKIPIKGYARPHIRMPEKDKYGHWTNWSKTALPWMSIGYETQIPPISTVTFYNAIANDGIMMRPRFVKSVMKDGKVIAEFPPEKVMERRIAKPQTIKTMQTILEHVVSQGLGRKAGSRMFKVAGKTGTAQIAEGGGYKTGIVKYWLSFAGYFPADNPRYSCIVCLKKSGLPASGGGMSGVVFHHISEGVMARNLKLDVKDAHDTASVQIPDVKNGNILDANYALRQLGIPTNKSWEGSYSKGNPIWGQAERLPKEIAFKKVEIEKGVTPSVIGMGAKDAVYLLESQGLKVRIHGRGKVKSQSYPAGKQIVPGSECIISLE